MAVILKDKKRGKRLFIIVAAFVALAIIAGSLVFLYMKQGLYTNEDFGIKTYISECDRDGDGTDDQTDILLSVREYIKSKPKYKSAYYEGGYPTDNYGVCTDVVAQGLLGAGYDLQQLVDEDIMKNGEKYDIEKALTER